MSTLIIALFASAPVLPFIDRGALHAQARVEAAADAKATGTPSNAALDCRREGAAKPAARCPVRGRKVATMQIADLLR